MSHHGKVVLFVSQLGACHLFLTLSTVVEKISPLIISHS